MNHEEIESAGWKHFYTKGSVWRYRANFYNERMNCIAIMEMIYILSNDWLLIYDLNREYKFSETRFAGYVESIDNLKLLMKWIGMDKVPPDQSDYDKIKELRQSPLTPDQCYKS